jgi:hypothetical protein
MFQNDVRTNIILEVIIYIPEHSRHDVDSTDWRSGRRDELNTTAREAMVSMPAPAPSTSALGQRRGGSRSDRRKRHWGCSRFALSLASRCCNGQSRSTLLRSGGDRRWGRVESLGPFRLLRHYRGLDLRGARMRGLRRSGGGGGGLLGRRRAALSNDLSKTDLERDRSAHAGGESVILEGRIFESVPDKT